MLRFPEAVMKLNQRAWLIPLALMAAFVAGCSNNESQVACRSDLSSRPADAPGLTVTYSGENLEMQVVAPNGFAVQPSSVSEITVDTGAAKLADMGTLSSGTYEIRMRDTIGDREDFVFEAIVAERQVTRVRLICS